jgi:transcriptional regulator
MYIPKHFVQTDENAIKKFIRENGFGILFSHDGHLPQATHLPFHLEECADGLYLTGHFARANEHWKSINNQEVLVVFPGAHTYISASWYEENGMVSTWNYIAVHVYGKCTLVFDEGELINILRQSVLEHEQHVQSPWNLDDNLETVKSMLQGIVGFKIRVNNIEAKYKLSQNHPKTRQERIIYHLENHYDLYDSKKIAELMKGNLNNFD